MAPVGQNRPGWISGRNVQTAEIGERTHFQSLRQIFTPGAGVGDLLGVFPVFQESLHLQRNNLGSIFGAIPTMKNLRYLNCRHNHLSSVPPDLGLLEELTVLVSIVITSY